MVLYNKEVLEERRLIIKKFVRLESDQVITKNMNNSLLSWLTGKHYDWLEWIFDKMGRNIAKDDLYAYHWVEDKEWSWNFANRRIVSIFRIENNMRKLNMAGMDFQLGVEFLSIKVYAFTIACLVNNQETA